MGGKVTVSGEQSSYSGKWTYNINSLDEWMVKTHEKFGKSGLVALAEIVKRVTFHVDSESAFNDGQTFFTDVAYGDVQVGIEKEELDQFCIKL
ncbi:hypothetical protein allfine_94 [Escherichia phage allfine]|uniref:Uncharacterized protein n=1 Tax=Escherichia phage allfine TaxID=2696380 RepID=A0A6B9XC90_9CAUD|nr:hypothetical protein allfine_94 [Escherichia phage allfine]